ncbi:MAG: nitrate- and nitrite sensing domain-containing protein [Burkholderiaceae bacterium]
MTDLLALTRRLESQARLAELRALRTFAASCGPIGRLRELIHCLQRERGATVLMMMGLAKRHAQRLHRYRLDSQGAHEAVVHAIDAWTETAEGDPACISARSLQQLAICSHELIGLAALRQRIDQGQLDAQSAMVAYGRVIEQMLTAAFEIADPSAHAELSAALVALLTLMQGKEYAGQERALGTLGIMEAWREGSDQLEALRLRAVQQFESLHLSAEFAPDDIRERLEALRCGELDRMVEDMRQQMTGTLAAGGRAAMGERWFDGATLRIDALKAVEDALEASLFQACAQRLADGAETGADAPVSDGAPLRSALDRYGHPDAAASLKVPWDSRLWRTLLDALHEQSQRLREADDALQAARTALAERKVVERAKAELISRWGMSEAQAYAALRESAMNQGRRLVDVAQATLDMVGVLSAQAGRARDSRPGRAQG